MAFLPGNFIHWTTKETRKPLKHEFKYEVRCDLRGCLEVTMASEPANMVVRATMHMDFRVIEVADYKSDIKFNL